MVDGSTQCYYLDASRNQQSATVGDLARLARSGEITRDTMVWFAGMPDWRPAGQVNELASLFAPSGPPAMRPPMAPPGSRPAPMRPASQSAGGFGGFDAQAAGNWVPARSVGFGGAIGSCFSKYVGFNGRAARSEFWWWMLFYFLALFVTAFIDGMVFGTLALYFLVVLALVLPTLAVAVRRMHDTDKSGWFVLLWLIPFVGFIIIIILACQPGTNGPNRFDVPTAA